MEPVKKLIILNSPQTPNLFVGETCIVRIPKRKFDFSWTIGNRFDDFAIELILLVFENLLVNKIISCQIEARPIPIPFYKMSYYIDTFQLESAIESPVGLVEEGILKIFRVKDDFSSEALVRLLFGKILRGPNTGKESKKKSYASPSKEVINKIIEGNRLNGWTTNIKKSWLGDTVEIFFDPSRETTFLTAINEIQRNCLLEGNGNAQFVDLLNRLRKTIRNEFGRIQNEDGGS